MARYFKYNPQQYESMFVPLPLDLFAAKLQGEQGKFDALEQASQQVQDQWRSLQVDPYDIEKRDKKIAEMKQEFSDVIDNSKGDVNRMYSELNRLNRDWNEYTTMGHGAAMAQSLAMVQEGKKKWEEAVAKGDYIEATYWKEFLNEYRQWGESGGTKPLEDGKYRSFSYRMLSPDFNADKWHKEIALPGWNANKESYKRQVGDYVTAESMEILDANRVYNGLYGDLATREDFERTTNNKFRYYTKDLDARGMINVALNGYDGNSGLISMRDGYLKKASELEKAGKKEEAAKYKAQADFFTGRINGITNAPSFEDAVSAATGEAYKVFKESEIQNTMALAMEKLPYVKQSWTELTRTPESDIAVGTALWKLDNPAKPVLTVNTGAQSDGDAIKKWEQLYTDAKTGKRESLATLIATGKQLVTDGALTNTSLIEMYNKKVAELGEGATDEQVVVAMADDALNANSVDEFNKKNGTKLTPAQFAEWKDEAVGTVTEYQVYNNRVVGFDNFVTGKANEVINDEFIKGIDALIKVDPMALATDLAFLNGESSTGKTWYEMTNKEKKAELILKAKDNPEAFLTMYANNGGNTDDMISIMYGTTMTATGGPIKELNAGYTEFFKSMSADDLAKLGAFEGVDEMFTPEEGGTISDVKFNKAPLGFGIGFVTMTFQDENGNTFSKVIDLNKNSNAAKYAEDYWAVQVDQWYNNPDTPSNATLQRELDKALSNYGALVSGNTLSPTQGKEGITQICRVGNVIYEVKPVKRYGQLKYELYQIDASNNRIPVLNSNDTYSYGSIEAVHSTIGQYYYEYNLREGSPQGTSRSYVTRKPLNEDEK